ncbi:hypothetical protein C8J57DRAFT_78814 [Mycena rebaudengoi]|nr:hypothetical protein C8J57DRAFT_78814 [Mycena rebaudengoi]
MFHTRSPYSPFFTSGLLSPQTSPTASLSDYDFTPRRGSLPSDAPPSYASSTADDASMFYFTLQPARDKDQYRSFLSLDLAESLSLRSHSTKRTREREPPFAVDFQIPDSPSVPAPDVARVHQVPPHRIPRIPPLSKARAQLLSAHPTLSPLPQLAPRAGHPPHAHPRDALSPPATHQRRPAPAQGLHRLSQPLASPPPPPPPPRATAAPAAARPSTPSRAAAPPCPARRPCVTL